MDSSAESDDWVQRRTPRACKLCRKKKVRCDGGQPACAQCIIHKSECVYLPRATRARQRVTKERRRSNAQKASSQAEPGACGRCSGASNASTMGEPSQQRAEPASANGFGISLTMPNTPEELADGYCPSDILMNETNGGMSQQPTAGRETIHCATDDLMVDQTMMENGTGDAGTMQNHAGVIEVAGNPSPDLDSADIALLSHLDLGTSHDGLLATDGAEIENLAHAIASTDPEFSHLLDPQILDDFDPGAMLDDPLSLNGSHNDGDYNVEMAEDIGHSLQVTMAGHFKYMGPSMSFIPATGPGQTWITHVTGSNYFSEQIHQFLEKWTPVSNAADDHPSYDYSALPSFDRAILYANAYFANVQCAFPVLDEKEFMEQLEASGNTFVPSDDPTWCAMVNTVLAIGCRATPGTEETEYCALFNNALSLFHQVSLGWSKLKKVQTLTLMYIFLSHTTSPHWGYTFLSTAVTECYAMGLHIMPMRSWSLSSTDLTRRSLLFWTIFCLDAQLLSRLGRPPLLRRREITLPMPSGAMTQVAFASQPYHHPGSCRDASAWGALFIQNIKTSHLILDVHDCINTAPQLSTLEPLINRLEEKIETFQSTIQDPTGLSSMPQLDVSGLPRGTILPNVIVQSNIYVAKWTLRLRTFGMRISRKAARQQFGIEDISDDLSQSLARDIELASEAAKNLIELIFSIPKNQATGAFWYHAPLPVFAFYVLFLSILYRPLGKDASSHMELMSIVIESTVNGAHMPHPLTSDLHLTHFLTFFSRTARMAISRARIGNKEGQRDPFGVQSRI